MIVAIAAMPWVIAVMAPGFEYGGERYLRAVELSRITFVYILFISLVALQGGVLNSLGKFAAAAAAPIVLNLCLIGALLVSLLWLASPAMALAWGVAAAGLDAVPVAAARGPARGHGAGLPPAALDARDPAPVRARCCRACWAPASPRSTCWPTCSSPRCCPRVPSPTCTTPTG